LADRTTHEDGAMNTLRARHLNERLSRETLAGYDPSVIDNAYVVIVGCGALGQAIAQLLGLIGFARILFVDMDHFELSNATRSPFFSPEQYKAEATSIRTAELCTTDRQLDYRYAVCRVQELGHALFSSTGRRLCFSAVDDPAARAWVSQVCRYLGVPLVEGGFHGHRTNLNVFANREENDPCWSCGMGAVTASRLFSCERFAAAALQQSNIPATAPCAAALAGQMVESGVLQLLDACPLANHTLFADVRTGHTQLMKRVRDTHCHADHEIVGSGVHQLSVGPENTIDELLAEIELTFCDPIVALPATYVVAAPCMVCSSFVRVSRPSWMLASGIHCKDCDGPFESDTGSMTVQHGTVSRPTSGHLLTHTLSTIGLGPGVHLRVFGRDQQSFVRLADSTLSHLVHATRACDGCHRHLLNTTAIKEYAQ
jgi:molybdopterin/thiamine biosynthesis adenylyltransferase